MDIFTNRSVGIFYSRKKASECGIIDSQPDVLRLRRTEVYPVNADFNICELDHWTFYGSM